MKATREIFWSRFAVRSAAQTCHAGEPATSAPRVPQGRGYRIGGLRQQRPLL